MKEALSREVMHHIYILLFFFFFLWGESAFLYIYLFGQGGVWCVVWWVVSCNSVSFSLNGVLGALAREYPEGFRFCGFIFCCSI